MTVLTSDTVERFTVSGVGPYAFFFRIFDATDLQVTACSAATPSVTTLLTHLTHYTVTGTNEDDGGLVTLTALAVTLYTGYTLDIRSNTPNEQPTSIRNQGRFLPEIHENAFDNLSRQIQDLHRIVRACLRFPDNGLHDGEMSPITGWLSKYLTINSSGVLEAAALSPTVVTASVISTLLTGSATDQDILQALLMERSDTAPALTSLKRTDAEIAAGVTPINYAKWPSPWKDISRFVSDNTGGTVVTTQMNAALKAEKNIIIPEGIYLVDDSLICQQDTNIDGAGPFSVQIKGNLSGKSFFRTAFGETPAVGQRSGGIRIANLGIYPATASVITAGSIGINLRNAQYCALENVLMQYVDKGLVTDQYAQYNHYRDLKIQVANTGAYLESIGGGNELVACHIAGNICALDINGGTYAISGGTAEALLDTTTYCIHVGRAAGQSTTVTGMGNYVEAPGPSSSVIALQIENSVIGSAFYNLNRHSFAGTIVNNAGEECIIECRGFWNPAVKAQRVAFSSTLTGSELASLRSAAGNSLESRNAANSGYADHLMKNVLLSGAPTGTSGFVTLGNLTQTTVGAAGGASALPATPAGYLRFFVGTTEVVLPYYARV